MTSTVHRQTREWLALLATLALLVHTALAGVADGAMASPLLDVFGNIICTSHGADRGPADEGGNAPGHSHLPECCLAGCTVAGGHAMPAAATATPPVPPARYTAVVVPAYVVARGIFELTPLNPRAPPAVV